ncbi:MAG: tRNA preQ1(34) S-adenosylmethionine ribosyltransferase-isomerase QueA [Alphaproteobacteria bacterium]|nr:tRNA preQ1(34) S-adenosylmethionine ribosyltransferase-isomerase QueA [Alphaproteobacteria bacterium]
MRVDHFDFDLPPERIAQAPIEPRDAARLLHVGATMADLGVRDLPSLLQSGDALVVNDTKVLPCRLTGKRRDAKVEITLHKPVDATTWLAFARPARKLKPEDVIIFANGFEARVSEKRDAGEVALTFNHTGPDLMNALEAHGYMPLPPYIKRDTGGLDADKSRYQTLFAATPGAAAAPTAGLHFTSGLMEALQARGVQVIRITLHVGAGTFLPVKVDDTDDHVMHAEWATLSADAAATLNAVRAGGGEITAVGSTALRTLESAARDDGTLRPFSGETDLFITPGYRFKVIDRIMTNFHLPKSTLFMLVSAFSGLARMQAAYGHAIEAEYRFFSYGDACLLEPDRTTWGNALG